MGLSQEYKDQRSEIEKWLKVSFGLQFMDPNDIEECFVEDVMAEALVDDR